MARLRVAGGELRGRRLHSAPGGPGLRPTTARVREAVFSILGPVAGLRVLDLFCGTGALGIEALSRGAAEAVLVDRDIAAARRNVEELGLGARTEVVRADAVRFLRRQGSADFDLVLCDPPYGLADDLASDLAPLIRGALASEGRVVVESAAAQPLELGLPLLTERAYGETVVRVHAGEGRR